jgi:hypothetical protein
MKPRGQYGFRLDPALAKKLEAEAEKRRLTPGRYARLLVIDALTDRGDEEALSLELRALRDEVEALKDNLTTATIAILQTATELPEEEVRKWADENLP